MSDNWIKCSDELPKDEEKVIIYYIALGGVSGGARRRFVSHYLIESKSWNGMAISDEATHWQPLPKPPKED